MTYLEQVRQSLRETGSVSGRVLRSAALETGLPIAKVSGLPPWRKLRYNHFTDRYGVAWAAAVAAERCCDRLVWLFHWFVTDRVGTARMRARLGLSGEKILTRTYVGAGAPRVGCVLTDRARYHVWSDHWPRIVVKREEFMFENKPATTVTLRRLTLLERVRMDIRGLRMRWLA